MFYLFVNGNRIHDREGLDDLAPLAFTTKEQGDRYADDLHADHLKRARRRFPAQDLLRPLRDHYVIAAEAPPVP